MKTTYITGARIFTGTQELDGYTIIARDGRVVELSLHPKIEAGAEVINLEGKCIAPGFIDIQLNGGYYSLFTQHPGAEILQEMTEACLEHATPYFCPTLVTASPEVVFEAIEAVRTAMQSNPHIIGMHLEGPFLSPKRKGAHNEKYIRRPDDAILREVIDRGRGVIKIITIAPEEFTSEQIDMLVESGIQVSVGHSNATYEQANAAFDRGIKLVTHLYNAMSPFLHREPNMIGAALERDEVYTPLILDGRHSHYGASRLAYKIKNRNQHVILITDAAVLGRKVKEIPSDNLHAILSEDGFYLNPDGNLAGSAISIPEALRNAQEHLGVSLQEAVEMVTSRVAKAISMEDKLGHIAPGFPAMFSVFDNSLSAYSVLNL